MSYKIIDNIKICYEIQGQGQPLVLIHGLGSSGRDWEIQRDFFAPHYQVITFDLRGHGQSDKPRGPYSIQLFTRDTLGLLEALDISQAHILGHSLGGLIAFQMAVDKPDLFKSMIIVNSIPEVMPHTKKERFQVWQRRTIVRFFGMRQMGKFLSKRIFPKPEQAPIRQIFVERWAENDRRAYLAAFDCIFGWGIREHLPHIHCPTLLIAAEYDLSPVVYKEDCVAHMPEAELVVIPDSRHAVPVEKPQEFNEAVFNFLERQ